MKARQFKSLLNKKTDKIRILINKMPNKGDTSAKSQKIGLLNALHNFESWVNGVSDEDFRE